MPETKKMFEMSEDEFREASNSSSGGCIACGEIQDSGCEPDARNYECDSCGEMKVFGIEELLLMGRVLIE